MSDKLVIEVDAKTIYDSLQDLSSKMDTVIKHQKITNGRVTANEKKISDGEKFHVKVGAYAGGAAFLGSFILNIIF